MRSINYVLIVALLLVVWQTARRVDLITNAHGAVLLSLLLFGGYGMTFNCRSGRYDMLGAVLMAAIVWVSTRSVICPPAAVIALTALLPRTDFSSFRMPWRSPS